MGISDFLGNPNNSHWDGSNEKKNRAKDEISATLGETGAAGKGRDGDKDSGRTTNELDFAHL